MPTATQIGVTNGVCQRSFKNSSRQKQRKLIICYPKTPLGVFSRFQDDVNSNTDSIFRIACRFAKTIAWWKTGLKMLGRRRRLKRDINFKHLRERYDEWIALIVYLVFEACLRISTTPYSTAS